MKIKVKDLEANPFRKIKSYPINRTRLNALKISIKETTFWDNVLARKKNGKYQIAYGHHRLLALRELGIKEIDIPIRPLDDATMIKIMANENMETWGLNPAVVNETILVAKEYLDGELMRHEIASRLDKNIRSLFEWTGDRKTDWGRLQNLKKNGIGRDTLVKFLGGNWKGWMIQEALNTLDLDKRGLIDRKTIETIPTIEQAKVFKNAVKIYKISKPQQKKLAERIVKEGIGKRDIPKTVRDAAPTPTRPVRDRELERLKGEMEKIDSKAASLCGTIIGFNLDMKKLNVEQLGGVKTSFALNTIADLLPAIRELLEFFGFNFKQFFLKGKVK